MQPAMESLTGMMPRQTAPDPQARLMQILERFRQIEMQIEAMAGEFPQSAKDLRAAVNSIRQAMSTAVSQPNMGTEPQAPRSLG
jgi:hypothetical protein